MSELSAKLSALKGGRKTSVIIQSAGVSRQTFRKIELGQSVKLSTLRGIADSLGVSHDQWIDLVVAWLKSEAGADSHSIWIEPRSGESIQDAAGNQEARAIMCFQALNAMERVDVIKAMQRKEVLACLPAINRVWEKFNSTG